MIGVFAVHLSLRDGIISKHIVAHAHRLIASTSASSEHPMINLTINGHQHSVEVSDDTPLLWVLREELNMTGTRFGCGKALCGACTVHLNGAAVRSCQLPVSAAEGQDLTTIEGLGGDHPVQKAWLEENVPQCGYCQSGQIMSAIALLAQNPHPSPADIKESMSGNICRCGTYPRIQKAILRMAQVPNATALSEGGSK